VDLLSSDELSERVRGLPALKPLLESAAAIDQRLYLVGGAVRDLLRGRAPVDIDVCIEGPLTTLLVSLPGEATVHPQFETATVTDQEMRYDIARARTETYPQPGALPQVQGADIASDMQRRDFTVNAIALELSSGELIAAAGALDDLRDGRLEVLHERSFLDDPTRLFRLVRYKARLGFEIGERTATLVGQAIESGVLERVSGARIGNELRLLAAEPDPVAAFAELTELDGGRIMLGGLGFGASIATAATTAQQPGRAEVASKALAVLPADGRRDLVVLAVCAIDMPAGELGGLLDEFGFPAHDRERIIAAATRSGRLAQALQTAQKPSQIATAVGTDAVETVAVAAALGAESQATQWLRQLRQMQPEVTGDDLTAAGITPGPAIGAALQAARLAMLDGEADERATQLQIALQAARSH
jgi:tRNA nucleotidyltransferase (CCA-adding enzyme)